MDNNKFNELNSLHKASGMHPPLALESLINNRSYISIDKFSFGNWTDMVLDASFVDLFSSAGFKSPTDDIIDSVLIELSSSINDKQSHQKISGAYNDLSAYLVSGAGRFSKSDVDRVKAVSTQAINKLKAGLSLSSFQERALTSIYPANYSSPENFDRDSVIIQFMTLYGRFADDQIKLLDIGHKSILNKSEMKSIVMLSVLLSYYSSQGIEVILTMASSVHQRPSISHPGYDDAADVLNNLGIELLNRSDEFSFSKIFNYVYSWYLRTRRKSGSVDINSFPHDFLPIDQVKALFTAIDADELYPLMLARVSSFDLSLSSILSNSRLLDLTKINR